MSDDPERNGISRLDEMMSGAVRSILDRVACFLYCIRISFTLLQICRCDSAESPLDTDWIIYVAVFYSQLASRVIRPGSVQSGCLSCGHVVCSNTLCHCALIIIKLQQTATGAGQLGAQFVRGFEVFSVKLTFDGAGDVVEGGTWVYQLNLTAD